MDLRNEDVRVDPIKFTTSHYPGAPVFKSGGIILIRRIADERTQRCALRFQLCRPEVHMNVNDLITTAANEPKVGQVAGNWHRRPGRSLGQHRSSESSDPREIPMIEERGEFDVVNTDGAVIGTAIPHPRIKGAWLALGHPQHWRDGGIECCKSRRRAIDRVQRAGEAR